MVVVGLWARVRFGLERGLVRGGADGVIWVGRGFGLVVGAGRNGLGFMGVLLLAGWYFKRAVV